MKIIRIKANKDGSADMTYQLSIAEVKVFKRIAKEQGKKYTDKFVNSIILKGIESLLK